jgi:hypothetical protein
MRGEATHHAVSNSDKSKHEKEPPLKGTEPRSIEMLVKGWAPKRGPQRGTAAVCIHRPDVRYLTFVAQGTCVRLYVCFSVIMQ